MDIRGSTCYLCGALSPRELSDFQHTCNHTSVCVCVVHACERENKLEFFTMVYF